MKRFFIYFFIIVLISIGYLSYKKSENQKINTDVSNYRNSSLGIYFQYPKELNVKSNSEEINIHHEIPFEHRDYCDFRGEATTTTKILTDFDVTIKKSNKNILETIKENSPYIPEENFLNDKVVIRPGFIEAANFGELNGYSIFEGAEGCGHTIYYFELSKNETLIVKNKLITVFSGTINNVDEAKALSVPGVINKEKSSIIFDYILKNMVTQ